MMNHFRGRPDWNGRFSEPNRGHRGRGPGGPDGRFDEPFRGPRGRGRAGQFFDSGELLLIILNLIKDSPRHGYEIIKLIENELGGSYTPSPGTIYPTLTMLEEMGFAATAMEGTRKLYSITEAGRKEVADNQQRVEQVTERMKITGRHHSKERPAPIIRAMENLKMVLRMRGAELTQQQIIEVSDIIDAAAKQIERL